MFEYKAQCLRVIDGDTIEVMIDLGFGIYKKEKVRLADIDTPEIFRPSCDAEKEHGFEAKRFVQSKITEWNSDLRLITKKESGKYGRYIAYVYDWDDILLDKTLGEYLIEEGFEKKESYK